ncbi:MAG: DUF2061 domain-containing protein [Bacteroidota bacterium]
MTEVAVKRHVAKTITWRLIGTLDTFLLTWLISSDPLAGLKIGLAEMITKMILYFLHERLWLRFKIKQNRKRHLYKTITWRIMASMDTIVLGRVIIGSPLVAMKLGILEVITKMTLYYFHERIWYKIYYGRSK